MAREFYGHLIHREFISAKLWIVFSSSLDAIVFMFREYSKTDNLYENMLQQQMQPQCKKTNVPEVKKPTAPSNVTCTGKSAREI